MLKRIFGTFIKPFLNSRGDVDAGGGGGTGDTGDGGDKGDKLLADKYKTIPELEEGYKNSQREYGRVSDENETLRTQLTQANQQVLDFQQSKEKREPEPEDYSTTFDKEAVEVIKKISRKEATDVSKQGLTGYEKLNKFQQNLAAGWDKALGEYGDDFEFVIDGKVNPESELYKRADSILGQKYIRKNPDGTMLFTTSDAHHLSVTEAFAQLTKEGKERKPSETSQDKRRRIGNLSGKGGPSAGKAGTLTREAYLALPEDKKDAYDRGQVVEKGGLQE